jgi:hypothetical protein
MSLQMKNTNDKPLRDRQEEEKNLIVTVALQRHVTITILVA